MDESFDNSIDGEPDEIDMLHKSYLNILKRNIKASSKDDIIISNTKEIANCKDKHKFYKYIKTTLMCIYGFKINKLKQIIMTFKFKNKQSLHLSSLIINPYLFIVDGDRLISFEQCEKIRKGENLDIDIDEFSIKSLDIINAWVLSNIITDSLYIRKTQLITTYNKFKNEYSHKLRDINISELLYNKIINNIPYCTTKELYNMELNMTDMVVTSYHEQEPLLYTELDKMIIDYENRENINFTDTQKKCIKTAIKNKFEIICGFPGTGKTTIVHCVLEILCILYDTDFKNGITLIAPTGMAVNNLKNSVKRGALKDISDDLIFTIHKYINKEQSKKLLGGNDAILEELEKINERIQELLDEYTEFSDKKLLNLRKQQEKLIKLNKESSIIIIDECSMIDLFMFNNLIKMCSENDCRLIMLGDINQLPPIGPGSILECFKDSGIFNENIHLLTEIKRQSGKLKDVILKMSDTFITINDFDNESFIFSNINSIFKSNNQDKIIKSELKQISFDIARTYDIKKIKLLNEKKQQILKSLELTDLIKLSDFINRYKFNPNDTQFISCQSSYSAGTDNMNLLLQEIFNPNGEIIYTPNRFLITPFRVGDYIYRNVNDYSDNMLRANGDIGKIIGYDNSYDDGEKYTVDIEHGKDDIETVSTKSLYDEFNLGYCKTIHKVQGSQYKNVVIMMPSNHNYMWEKEGLKLLYTAVSRSINKCYIVGDIKLFSNCQINREYKPRISLFLKEGYEYDLL
jgi:ATP-dependent exoDNAse (exonuclease V) alpha subunit